MYANFLSSFSFTLHLFLLIARLKESKRLLGYLCFSLATSNFDTSSFTSSYELVLLITFYSLNTSSYSLELGPLREVNCTMV